MFRASVFFVGLSVFAAPSFEPAKLQSGTVKPVKYRRVQMPVPMPALPLSGNKIL